jgi:hypothetical protein
MNILQIINKQFAYSEQKKDISTTNTRWRKPRKGTLRKIFSLETSWATVANNIIAIGVVYAVFHFAEHVMDDWTVLITRKILLIMIQELTIACSTNYALKSLQCLSVVSVITNTI